MPPDLDLWGLPDEETMSCEDGLFYNHFYRDLRWMGWSDYDSICQDELSLLTCGHEIGSEDYDEFAEGEDNECWRMDLDPGVASTVAALAAMGAVPISCCRGGTGHYEEYPLVVFWGAAEHREPIEKAAEKVKASLEYSMGCIIVSADVVGVLMDFAEELEGLCRY
jgi:hypothetical protein